MKTRIGQSEQERASIDKFFKITYSIGKCIPLELISKAGNIKLHFVFLISG
jgi:hypothetical protein